ncbi:hypothetical protein BDZ89DRAFT_1083197 [Hymenopellis radicata]|nr:hypothetical protein BDZ89DRAFT_1083197 [Hymenopellis radicata]
MLPSFISRYFPSAANEHTVVSPGLDYSGKTTVLYRWYRDYDYTQHRLQRRHGMRDSVSVWHAEVLYRPRSRVGLAGG